MRNRERPSWGDGRSQMLCWGHGEPCEESSKEEQILGGSFWLQDEGGWETGETGGQPGIVLRPCAAGIREEEANSGSDLVKVGRTGDGLPAEVR